MDSYQSASILLDFTPSAEAFLDDVLAGLVRRPRSLPGKYLYDERGSRIFEEICGLQEYYPPRTELAIMRRYAEDIAARIGPGVMLVEFGSGSGLKTRVLLDHLVDPVAFVPVDISREHLLWTAERLSVAYPNVEVMPVCADLAGDFHLPSPLKRPSHTTVYFPASTISNFHPETAREILARIAGLCGPQGDSLIGIDLQKNPTTLEAAYRDERGVTAEFNLNLLRRINRELDGSFDLTAFEHRAVYNQDAGRIELYLVSRRRQEFTICGNSFCLEAGEPVCTEYSYKYTVKGFAAMAAKAGLTLQQTWTDEQMQFAVLHLGSA